MLRTQTVLDDNGVTTTTYDNDAMCVSSIALVFFGYG